MVRILIIGATGYIGKVTSKILRKHNHRIYALARSPEKAKWLEENEIIPIRGSVEDSKEYLDTIQSDDINLIIDFTGIPTTTPKIISDLTPLAKSRNDKFSHGPPNKIAYVYCSGLWVHGDSLDQVSDLDLVGVNRGRSDPPDLVKWRPPLEDSLLKNELFDVIIVRPGMVYGGAAAIWGYSWGPIVDAVANDSPTATIPLKADTMFSLIHIDDVAEGFLAVVNNFPLLSKSTYPVFDLVTSYEPLLAINKLVAHFLNYKGTLEYNPPKENKDNTNSKIDLDDLLLRAFSTSVNTTSERLTALTGWKPTKLSMLSEIDLYLLSWKASL